MEYRGSKKKLGAEKTKKNEKRKKEEKRKKPVMYEMGGEEAEVEGMAAGRN